MRKKSDQPVLDMPIKHLKALFFALWMCVFNPSFTYANAYDAAVWADGALKSTLAISYKDTPQEIKAHKQYFSAVAWDALRAFLGHYIPVIRKNYLILTPYSVSYASVSKEGYIGDDLYWEIHEEIAIPQLNLKVLFKVVVVDPDDSSRKYIIQKISMFKTEY